jgi:hypothetical protein
VYYNDSVSLTGASYLGGAAATFDAPHTYSIAINKALATGAHGYFIIVFYVSTTATDEHTVLVNGSTNPVVFGYTTAPNVTNSQSNKSKTFTIQAADITLTTATIAAGNIARGSSNNIIYAGKMKVTTEPVTVNNIQFTLTGTHDNDDLTNAYIYFNPTAVSLTGASYLGGTSAAFAAPHTYSVAINKSMNSGDEGYFMIVITVSSTATIGHTVRIDGATDPLVFGFVTAPNITDNQNNGAGVKTISISFAKEGDNITEGAMKQNDKATGAVLNPNPAASSFSCAFNLTNDVKAVAIIKDYSGKVTTSKSLALTRGNNRVTMNVSSVPNGVYYFIVQDQSGVLLVTKQVVIQH